MRLKWSSIFILFYGAQKREKEKNMHWSLFDFVKIATANQIRKTIVMGRKVTGEDKES